MACIQIGFKVLAATLLPNKKRKYFLSPFQYQGPVWLLVEYKENNKYGRKKFQNLKSHDCHMLMTQLLPIALRGILSKMFDYPL
jgi:hypothetical protein